MTDTCGCCEGIEQITPITIINRPGLSALVYRIGTHRRSILELARLVGYKLGPGVASSTYLAYTLQNGYNTLIPAGSRAQNIPAAGQLPQSFETSEDLQARASWSNLQPRMSIPEYITQLGTNFIDTNTPDGAVYLAGTSTNLKPHDPVLFVFGDSDGQQVFAHVQEVAPHAAEKYTSVTFPITFTPLVFLRNLLDLVDRYLDLPAFGVSASDPGVEEILPLLELGKTLLELGKVYLQQMATGNLQTAEFNEIGKALYLIGVLLLWLERLLDLLISNGSPTDIHSTIGELALVSNEIERDLSRVKNSSVKQLLQSVQTASQLFLQQVMQPDLSGPLQRALTLLQPFTEPGQHDTEVSNIAQAVLRALQEIAQQTNLDLVAVLQAVQNALSNLHLTNPDAINLAQNVQNALRPFTSPGTSVDLVTVLVTVRQALSTLQVTDQNVTALVQASLAELDQLLQTARTNIDTLLQAVNDALDSFLTWVTNVFATNSSIHQTLTRSMALLKGIPRTLVHTSIHIPAIRNVLPASSRISTVTAMFSRVKHFPPDPLQDTLATWCDVYQNAAVNKTIGLANWVGALLTEVKSLASGVPGISQLLGNVCTPAVISGLGAQVEPLLQPPNLQPPSSARLKRKIDNAFARSVDIAPQLLIAFQPQLASTIYTAYSNAPVTPPPPLQEFDALRVKAALFGCNAPCQPVRFAKGIYTYGEWDLVDADKDTTMLYLDARYDHIVPESWVVLEYTPTPGQSADVTVSTPQIHKIKSVETLSRADYGISAKVTRLILYDSWFTTSSDTPSLALMRGITVYAQSEKLPLAQVPLTDDIAGQDVELDDLYDGLQSGRWMVISGERTDIPNITGVMASELMMLASVTQDVRQAAPTLQFTGSSIPGMGTGSSGSASTQGGGDAGKGSLSSGSQPPSVTLPGDTIHTTLHFATSLAHAYKRSTVTINGNVIPATQGETQNQILGSGSGGTPMQQFSLAKSPLTYIPAVTPTGEESTLQVFVNNVRWHEVDNLDAAQPTGHVYITQADNQDKVTITFGNGAHGARLPTGNENVKAVYRTGIGTSGNVDIGKITQLVSKPLGVKAVNNPIAATGGADRETTDQARANVPLAATSLGRIVSVQDYADFARTFPGIGKASAAYLSDGQQQVVHLTIVGQDNIPIDPTSSLYQSLLQSLHTFGDPSTPFMLALADVKILIISARVSIQADHLFDDVAAALRSALLDAFSFERRDLGQPVFQSEVLSVMQQVAGVAYVDLDVLDAITQQQLTNALQQIQADALKTANTGQQPTNLPDLATLLQLEDLPVVPSALARLDNKHPGNILPAQLVFLTPDVQDTLILNELTALTFKPASHKHHHAHSHRRLQ